MSLLAAALALLGCRATELEIRQQDLAVSGALAARPAAAVATPPVPAANPRQAVCADETGWHFEVQPHTLYTATIDAPGVLAFSACAAPRGSSGRGPSCLKLRLGAAEHEVCPRFDGWVDEAFTVPAGADRLEIEGLRYPIRLREPRVRSERQVPRRRLEGRPGRQILLLSIDTLRADAASREGGRRPTPALDALATEAQSFRRHYAGAHWTKPSHATLLTGLPAAAHGATEVDTGLNPHARTLAERFRAAGFVTEADVRSIANLDPRWGFDRGFDSYQASERRAGSATRGVLGRLQALRDRPHFVFLHLFEAHSDFSALPYESRGTNRRRVEQEFGAPQYGCREGKCASELLKAIDDGAIAPTDQDRRLLPVLYQRGVEDVEATLGEFFADLKATGLWDQLTIVVTSDHGESLLEHDRALHTVYYEPVIRVPLWIKWARGVAGAAEETLAGPTSAWDVAPTLLASAGLEVGDLPGRSLLGPPSRRVVFAGGNLEMVLEGNWKAIWPSAGASSAAPAGSASAEAPPRLFDLAADPGENDDQAARRPQEVTHFSRLRAAARLRFSQLVPGAPSAASPLTEEEILKLRSLGYLN
jgi:arylsulfatase A-like enzyme